MTYADPAVGYDQRYVLYDGAPLEASWFVEVWDLAGQTPIVRPLTDVADVSFEHVANDIGRGSLTIPADHPHLVDICDPRSGVETMVRVFLHGRLRYGFLARAVEDVFGDDGARLVRISGPGQEEVLRWGRVLWRGQTNRWRYGFGAELLDWGTFDSGNNLVANGGFEDATTDPWVSTGNPVIDSTDPHSGAWSMRVTAANMGEFASVDFNVGDNWQLYCDLLVRCDTTRLIRFILREAGGAIIDQQDVPVGTSWGLVTLSGNSGFSQSPANLTIMNVDGLGPATLWVDDVYVIGQPPQLAATSAVVRLQRLWHTSGLTGIELVFSPGGGEVEYTFPVEPGEHYTHTVWVTGASGDVGLRLELGGATITDQVTLTVTGIFHQLVCEGDAGPAQTTGRATLYGTESSQQIVYADDFSIIPGLPAATAGKIVSDVVAAMQARGTLTFLSLGFDGSVDSGGVAWPETLSMDLDPAWTLFDLLSALVGFGYEWLLDGTELRLWGPLGGGTDWTGLAGAPTILPGPTVESADGSVSNPPVTVTYVEGSGGVWTVVESGLVGSLGRREDLVVSSQTGETAQLALVGQRRLDSVAPEAFSVRLTDAMDPLPYFDFGLLDTVRVSLPLWGPAVDYEAQVLADKPVAYWRLGETSGTTAADSSGNGHNGTYAGGPTLGQAGLLTGDPDTAVSFDGVDDRVTVPQDPALKLPGAMSVEAWIRPTALTAPADIVRQGVIGDVQYGIFVDQFGIARFTWYDGAFKFVTSPAGLIVAGNTYHIAATRDASLFVRLYVDGAQVAQGQGTAPTGNPAIMQISGAGGVRMFNGLIDEVAVYPTALSPDRVAAHYDAGIAGPQRLGRPTEIPDDWYRVRAIAFAGAGETMRWDVDFGRYRLARTNAQQLLLSRMLEREPSNTWTPGEGNLTG